MDIPTRSSKFSDLKENDKWFHGSNWLHLDKKDWPAQPEELKCNTECFEELRSESKPNAQESSFAFITSTDNKKDAQPILDYTHYSNFDKIIKVVAFILRFVKNCRKQSKIADINLTVPELKEAEICVIKDMQGSIITDTNFGQLKGQFNLFVDEHNLIRSKGRCNNSDLHFYQVSYFQCIQQRWRTRRSLAGESNFHNDDCCWL